MSTQCSPPCKNGYIRRIHAMTKPSSGAIDLSPLFSIRRKSLKCGISISFNVKISARQRTYEASYWRTALSQFSFSIIVLSMFQSVFYSIGGIVARGFVDDSSFLCLCNNDVIYRNLSTRIIKQGVLFRWTWSIFPNGRENGGDDNGVKSRYVRHFDGAVVSDSIDKIRLRDL
jgi:hypothetical protein